MHRDRRDPLRAPFDSAVATGTRRRRHDRPAVRRRRASARTTRATEAYGTIDEAVAALGIARADLGVKRQSGRSPPTSAASAELILRLQRELFVVGAELATNPDAWDRLQDGTTRVSAAMVDGVDAMPRRARGRTSRCRASSSSPARRATSAALELARTILRRAERRAVTLAARGPGARPSLILPYLNRLADLVWVLARAAEQAEARHVDRGPARPGRGRPNAASPDRGAIVTGQPRSPTGRPMPRASSASARRRRSSSSCLVGAFVWMFAGLLLTAGVAYLVGVNEQLLDRSRQYWFLLVDRPVRARARHPGAITRLSATAALGLFFVYAAASASRSALIVVVLHDGASVATAFLSAAGDVRGRGALRHTYQARRSPASAASCSWA